MLEYSMTAITPMVGLNFGRWVVICSAPSTAAGAMWLCRCECGTERNVLGKKLRNGHSKSCGCLRADVILANLKHPSDPAPCGPLTQQRLKEVLHYDQLTGDWHWLKRLAWRVDIGMPAGSINAIGYRQIGVDGTVYLAHRLAWFYMTGRWPLNEIDHRDLNKSNCSWENLRLADHSENASNVIKRANNSSGFKGVWGRRGCWTAELKSKGKKIYLGQFETPEEASAAYEAAAKRTFGEFYREPA